MTKVWGLEAFMAIERELGEKDAKGNFEGMETIYTLTTADWG